MPRRNATNARRRARRRSHKDTPRTRATSAAAQMLKINPDALRSNPSGSVDPDLVNLASDLEHEFLLTDPD